MRPSAVCTASGASRVMPGPCRACTMCAISRSQTPKPRTSAPPGTRRSAVTDAVRLAPSLLPRPGVATQLRLTVANAITALGSGRRLGRVRRGRPLLSRPRGAVGSGAAAVESAADSVVSRVRWWVGMVVRVGCPCVPCLSRVRVNVNTTDATAGATALLLPAQNTHTLHDPKRDT